MPGTLSRDATAAAVRRHLPVAIAAIPLAAAVVLAFHDGGYRITSWGVGAIAVLGVLAVTALALQRGIGGVPGAVAVAGWFGLAGWQGISALWADDPSAATEAMGLTLLYGGAFALVLAAAPGARALRRLIDLALLAAVALTVSSVGARLIPDLIGGDDNGRLATPISYWNNLALVFAFGWVLAAGVAGDPTRHPAVRTAAAAALPLFPLGILFTQSRGALVVLLLGSAALLVLARGRLETGLMLAAGLAVSVPLLLYANGFDELSPQRVIGTPHVTQGARVLVALLFASAATALAALAAPRVGRLLDAAPRRRTLAGVTVAAAALVALTAGLATRPPDGGPLAWADRQIDSFQRYDPRARDDAESVSDRLAVAAGSGRWQNWSVAAEEFRSAPLMGTGAGDYRFLWAQRREIDITVRNAHSLYLETLGESGLVGLALLLLPLGATGVAIVGALRRRPPPELARDLGIAGAAGAVIAFHLAGDWAWQMPAVVLPGLVLGAAAISASRGSPTTSRRNVLVAWALAAVAVAGIVVLAGPVSAADRLDEARGAARGGDLVHALDIARDAVRVDPQNADARLLEANLLDDLGRYARADAAFAAALARSPEDWTIHADWASSLLARGERASARLLVERATPLNPRDERIALLRAELRS
ncbi:MAG TPA: O-antigen ligase family protein [Miltoncostaeaceae bacterium]|nr:O-antigen ligase family protein [Miltoncostaeaceae bacterium]